ncbi:MAG: hypothetical protein KDA32_03295 [Phycisphaerales bacterium]|nr:hypothetical protein [Phycisphaerales bacterium]
MLRRFRHRLFLLLQAGLLISGGVAFAIEPEAWRAIVVCVGGGMLMAILCERLARTYLRATLGRLRRAAEDLGRGRSTDTMPVQPGDDLHKLIKSINLVAGRLADASEEERRLQEALRQRERLAFLGELAASVAHEVNNPLDGVQNCARILRKSLDKPDRARQMLDLMDGGLERIELIVRRLLTLARENVIRPEPVALRDVLQAAVELADVRIRGRDIHVDTRIETTDDHVPADRHLLAQVFSNLMLNAADSMGPGGSIIARVRESTDDDRDGNAETPSDERHICVDIIDSGAGIAPAHLAHIFEPFYTTKTDGKGTGLGLAIAARIVDAHGGTIAVDSKPDHGTRMTVRLPARLNGGAQALRGSNGSMFVKP